MADSTSYTWNLVGNDRGASRAIKNVGDAAGHAHTLSTALGTAAGTILAKGFGVAFTGAEKLFGAFKDGIGAARRYQTLQAASASVLKSTGNVAGTTVKRIDDLAGSLESLSGVDEELIINSQNVLATFTQIRNTKTADIFDQATKAALNLSTAMHGDLQGATVQVGKALNDPIKGITALSRAGVTFTDDQKKLIATYMKHGETAKAQGVILAELNKEFGGAAKAAGQGYAGAMARAQDAIGDTFRAIGQQLLPTLTQLANWIASDGVPKATAFASAVGPKIVTAFKMVVSFGAGVLSFYRQHSTLITSAAVGIGTVVGVIKVWQAVTKTMAAAQLALNIVMMANPIGLVVLALAGIAAGLIYAYKTSESFRNGVNLLWQVARDVFAGLVDKALWFAGVFIHAADAAFGWIPGIGGKLHKAALQFDAFRDDVNRSLRGIQDRQVNVTVRVNAPAGSNFTRLFGSGKRVPIGATGGVVRRPTFALLGEAGPEAVVPLDRTAGNAALPSRLGGDGMTVHIHVTQPLGTADQIGTAVAGALASYARSRGGVSTRSLGLVQ